MTMYRTEVTTIERQCDLIVSSNCGKEGDFVLSSVPLQAEQSADYWSYSLLG